ncbi:MAG TPA: thiaminase II [Candidatus Binatia bacterium]|nr:thiaminase II [Candidatus Binatia bacterium]
MSEKFSAVLRRRGDKIWRAIQSHAFLRELHAGTLAPERFNYFILQDYVYLLDFAQVLCFGGAKSPSLATLEVFARHALSVIQVERSFHTSFGKTLGLSKRELDETVEGPVTRAYIDHLQAVARGGGLNELVAAVLPCYWIYGETGKRLFKDRPRRPKVYRQWIELYASDEFWRSVREQIDLVDHLGGAAGTQEKRRMTAHFVRSSRYEYLFWDQAYGIEQWRI